MGIFFTLNCFVLYYIVLHRTAVLPNYEQCLEAGRQTVTADFGYISSVMPQRQGGDKSTSGGGGSGSGGSRGVAVLAHGQVTTTSTTSSLSALTDAVPPCPIELIARPGQRVNFTLYDFAPRNLSYPNTARQIDDYEEDSLSKICHRSVVVFLYLNDNIRYMIFVWSDTSIAC